ncbi:MAG: phage/plasmid primase, P4 family [Dehalococcoidia bacterium]|jgi:putative DNA primase/helicase
MEANYKKDMIANIPQELRELDQWVIWKSDKHPRKAYDGKHASVSDPGTWSPFDVACASLAKHHCMGVGFVLTESDPYTIIDLDKVIDEKGNIDPKAQEIIDKMDSYTEISKSGRGIHIVVRGKKPNSRCRKANTEIYDNNRYFALTGNIYQGREDISERPDELEWLCAETFEGGQEPDGDSEEEEEEIAPISVVLTAEASPPQDKIDELLADASFKCIWEGDSNLKSLSDCDWKLAQIAYDAEWEDQEVADLIIAFRRKIGDEKDLKKALRKDYIVRTLASVKKNPVRRYNLTDLGNARYLAKISGEELRYDNKKGRWLYWGGHIWRPERNNEVSKKIILSLEARRTEAASIKNKKSRSAVIKWTIQCENTGKVNACISAAKRIDPITDPGDNWDNNAFLMGAKNGVIDLRTGKLRAGSTEDRITMSVGLDYDPDAKCPRWEKFLEEIFSDGQDAADAEFIDWLWRVLGYTITGDTTEHIIMMGYGGGANGKSRFLNAIYAALGDYAHTAPFSAFSLPAPSSSNDLASIDLKRFVTSSETNAGTRLNIERLKALSGEDKVSARFLYKEFEEFKPHAKVWLFVNHKPEIDDDTIATWRRVRLIPFIKTFTKEKADNKLGEKLRAEAPGILAWLVRGCLEWQKRGLKSVPERIRQATGEYRKQTDPLLGFIEEQCVQGEGQEVRAGQFYNAFREWMQGERKIPSLKAVGQRMSSLGFNKIDKASGIYYQGVGLKNAHLKNGRIAVDLSDI